MPSWRHHWCHRSFWSPIPLPTPQKQNRQANKGQLIPGLPGDRWGRRQIRSPWKIRWKLPGARPTEENARLKERVWVGHPEGQGAWLDQQGPWEAQPQGHSVVGIAPRGKAESDWAFFWCITGIRGPEVPGKAHHSLTSPGWSKLSSEENFSQVGSQVFHRPKVSMSLQIKIT